MRSGLVQLVNKPMLSDPLKIVGEFLIELLPYADTQVTAKFIIKNGFTNERNICGNVKLSCLRFCASEFRNTHPNMCAVHQVYCLMLKRTAKWRYPYDCSGGGKIIIFA